MNISDKTIEAVARAICDQYLDEGNKGTLWPARQDAWLMDAKAAITAFLASDEMKGLVDASIPIRLTPTPTSVSIALESEVL